ncbi:hypothetical protein CBM2634_B160299 [Cupriavidus taiwanensis]|uniref:Uncharacterized protein n=1 Tax=Cupriavidus taiwanensis TaxID=164546 RepID=A0A375J8Z7_9BURK|nr:hypothetical protein CBM2634_B160299 [Cupriavidus taiwanensis]
MIFGVLLVQATSGKCGASAPRRRPISGTDPSVDSPVWRAPLHRRYPFRDTVASVEDKHYVAGAESPWHCPQA